MTTIYWRCDRCGCTGSDSVTGNDAGAWSVLDAILTLHRSVAGDCSGGADTIRVSPQPVPKRQEPQP